MASSGVEESSLDTSLSTTEPSLDTTAQSSLDESQSSEATKSPGPTTAADDDDDDDDDELLALRIAALESIKLKSKTEEKKPEPVVDVSVPPPTAAELRPAYVITAHPARNNLVSIITEHEEIEHTLAPVVVPNYPPPPIRKYTSPPPSPVPYRSSPPYRPRYRSRSRSFERRRSFSPGGGRYYSPPRNRSPYRSPPRRWSPTGRRSPLPPNRRSPPHYRRSPNGHRRSPPPVRRSPMRPTSPRQRSPMRRSPVRRSGPRPVLLPTPVSESEWETDSDPPTEDEEENKENVANQQKSESSDTKEAEKADASDQKDDKASVEKSATQQESKEETKADSKATEDTKDKSDKLDETDQSQDDFLKLDATAEVDEFSRFLNEFENELETDDVKSTKAATDEAKPAKTAKKARIETERKTVDGKKMRKKIKAKRAQTPSLSPEGGGSGRWRRGRRESPLSRRSPGNTNRDRDRPNIRQSPNRDRTNRQSPFGQKKGERTSRPPMEEKREEEEKARREMEEQEKKEYEERLAKLPSPERKRLEARRKKFDSKNEVVLSKPKKISLRTESSELNSSKRRRGDTELEFSARRDSRRGDTDHDNSLDGSDGQGISVSDLRKRARETSESPPRKKQVTDLRVQLHKRKQAKQSEDNSSATATADTQGKRREPPPPLRRREPSPRHEEEPTGRVDDLALDEDEAEEGEPVQPMKGRIIVPPISKLGKRAKGSVSPSGDRRILVRKKSVSPVESPETEEQVSPKKKTLKTSLLSRLGDKLETTTTPEAMEFTEEEIWAEMMRQKNKKLKKKIKKEEKREKKEKKKKKSLKVKEKKSVVEKDEGEEEPGEKKVDDIFNFFEAMMSPEHSDTQPRTKSRTSSGDSLRLDWSPNNRSRTPSGQEVNVRDRLGDKVDGEEEEGEVNPKHKRKSTDKLKLKKNEDLDLSVEGEDILKKMKRRNEKRMARLKEIERDKLMFS